MRKLFLMIVLAFLCYPSFGAENSVKSPKPYGPVPTEAQLRWHAIEYFGLVHYGPNTYTGNTWGYGDTDPALFNPSNLDTDQWAKACKDGGLRGMVVVVKHHDGFCLWPTKTTKYNISATPWKNGKGDLIADLVKSCKKFDIKLGLYISPWDRNHAEYAREQYVKDFHEQWREVLAYDDDIFEIWLDGANGGTGWYGGAKDRRTIPKDYYQFDKLFKLCKEKQPMAVFFNMPHKTDCVRWVGNEGGRVPEQNWCRIPFNALSGQVLPGHLRGPGMKTGDIWMPAEADTSFHRGWFWSKSRPEKDYNWLRSTWYGTVGRGAGFSLGLAPTKEGLLTQKCVDAMKKLKEHLDHVFAVNLVESAEMKPENVRGKSDSFGPKGLTDGDTKTYWATDDGVQKGTILINFPRAVTFDHLVLQEHIALGQRIHAFHLEAQKADGTWQTVTKGTTIGYKKIMTFKPQTFGRLRLTLETDAPCLTLAELGLYNGSREQKRE